MSSIDRIVIVGAGLAGARAAEGLRTAGYEGRIALLGDEPDRPYLRPPLSKEYLRGASGREEGYVHPEGFYDEHRIELRPSTPVVAIDARSRQVTLDGGERLPFDRLLIATGARPRPVTLSCADLAGIFQLRTAADADAIRAASEHADRIVVIGTGWIGSEVAASLRMLGRHVTLVGRDAAPLQQVLGSEISGVYRDLHVEHGVDLQLGSGVARFKGRERIEAVETDAGDRIPADMVVLGLGVEPRTELAKAAGLAVGDGIEVGETLETSAAGIFAAGDVASAWHPFYGRRLRSEHWASAKFQGAAVAPLLLGATDPYDRLPYFYSDQYDVSMEYTGDARGADRLVVRGSLPTREFVAFWLAEGRVIAGMNVNVDKVAKPIERLIRSRVVVDADVLADPSVPIDDVAGMPSGA